MNRNRAYCPRCDRMTLVGIEPLGAEGVVEVCAVCDNALIYESLEHYLDSERQRLARMSNCDHEFERPAAGAGPQCAYCGLPEGAAPEDRVDERALDAPRSDPEPVNGQLSLGRAVERYGWSGVEALLTDYGRRGRR